MNAQEQWKKEYRIFRKAIQPASVFCLRRMYVRRREAALERLCEAQARTIEAQARTIEAERWLKDVE